MTAMSGRIRPMADGRMRQAALACIGRLGALRCDSIGVGSPSGALADIATAFTQVDMSNRIWVVEAQTMVAASRRAPMSSAVATWFRGGGTFERPLLYLLHSPALRDVLVAGAEATGLRGPREPSLARRGIFLNDANLTLRDRRARVRPELPLWLAAQTDWLPYDPASAQELKALLCAALDALYVRGESGFCYLSAHDVPCPDASPLGPADASDAFRGMYRLHTLPQTHPPYVVRLCGAGRALASVREAARWLQLDWGVASEVWSCPSYTRLAREAGEVVHRAMLGAPIIDDAHLTRCLTQRTAAPNAPVLAVTGYARHIANQIGAFVPARFAALGCDDIEARADDISPGEAPGVRWIVLNALRLLADDGVFARTRLAEATRRYGLA